MRPLHALYNEINCFICKILHFYTPLILNTAFSALFNFVNVTLFCIFKSYLHKKMLCAQTRMCTDVFVIVNCKIIREIFQG